MSKNNETLTTIRLWYEPDRDLPRFKRLCWEKQEVSLRDVLTGGLHPWIERTDGIDAHPSLVDAFLERFNSSAMKVEDLESFGYCNDVIAYQAFYYRACHRFLRTLEQIHDRVHFADDLTYVQLLDTAKRRLRDRWNNSLARTLADRSHPGFQGVRQFLKSKDKSIKLSRYSDIDQYDLGRILSLDDFQNQEAILISEALPMVNIRKTSFLDSVTDGQGRLRLAPDIRKLTLTMVPNGSDYVHLSWHVDRDGETCRFRPELGSSEMKRRKAAEFSKQWRDDDGRLCFCTSMKAVSEMVAGHVVLPSFPALNYTCDRTGPVASASVSDSRVPVYCIGGFYGQKSNGDTLKEILREYGVSMSGTKKQLLHKLAGLAAKQYVECRPEMDSFFARNRFVRVNAAPSRSEQLPLLEDAPFLRNLLLTMYAMKHLRGNAILDVAHDNSTYTEQELAHALLMGKVCFSGGLLRVA